MPCEQPGMLALRYQGPVAAATASPQAMCQPTLMRATATMIASVARRTSTNFRKSHSWRLATSGP